MGKSVSLCFLGQPIPCVRTTRKSLWTERSLRYAEYKKSLALFIQAHRPGIFTGRLGLSAVFVRADNRRCDIDNLLKSLMDAFNLSGIVSDDSQIKKLKEVDVIVDKKNPRVEFTLYEL